MNAEFWTEARVDALRQLVNNGLSYSEIGARWGVSRNVPIGKAHRLGIVHPNSPLLNGPKKASNVYERLIPLQVFPPSGCCVYPIGHPGEEGFRFCESKAMLDGPYCAEHHRVCHD